MIMKFSAGKPRLQEIRTHIASTWALENQPAVGYLDPRHVTLNMASQSDTKKALACPSNKIDTSLFRLFRWTPDFETGKESSFVPVWVKFYNLPLNYYNESSLHRLGSLLGTVLRVDEFTLDLMHHVYARVCIELDVTQELVDKLWVGTSKEHGWMVTVEYEGNHAFCSYCGILGHTVGLCRKKRQTQGKTPMDAKTNDMSTDAPRTSTKDRNQWIVKSKAHDTQPTTQAEKQNPRVILKRPHEGVTDDTRQALKNVGLLSDDENQQDNIITSIIPQDTRLETTIEEDPSRDAMCDQSYIATRGSEEMQCVTQQQMALEKYLNENLQVQDTGDERSSKNSSGNKSRKIKGLEPRDEPGVITTPTKNRFDVLDTESELQIAFKNLQHTATAKALVTIQEDQEHSFSDGSGTKSKSKMGLQRSRSEPNSDEEKEGDKIDQRKNGNKEKRDTSSSEQTGSPSNVE